jgi:hypothetical protein
MIFFSLNALPFKTSPKTPPLLSSPPLLEKRAYFDILHSPPPSSSSKDYLLVYHFEKYPLGLHASHPYESVIDEVISQDKSSYSNGDTNLDEAETTKGKEGSFSSWTTKFREFVLTSQDSSTPSLISDSSYIGDLPEHDAFPELDIDGIPYIPEDIYQTTPIVSFAKSFIKSLYAPLERNSVDQETVDIDAAAAKAEEMRVRKNTMDRASAKKRRDKKRSRGGIAGNEQEPVESDVIIDAKTAKATAQKLKKSEANRSYKKRKKEENLKRKKIQQEE